MEQITDGAALYAALDAPDAILHEFIGVWRADSFDGCWSVSGEAAYDLYNRGHVRLIGVIEGRLFYKHSRYVLYPGEEPYVGRYEDRLRKRYKGRQANG